MRDASAESVVVRADWGLAAQGERVVGDPVGGVAPEGHAHALASSTEISVGRTIAPGAVLGLALVDVRGLAAERSDSPSLMAGMPRLDLIGPMFDVSARGLPGLHAQVSAGLAMMRGASDHGNAFGGGVSVSVGYD